MSGSPRKAGSQHPAPARNVCNCAVRVHRASTTLNVLLLTLFQDMHGCTLDPFCVWLCATHNNAERRVLHATSPGSCPAAQFSMSWRCDCRQQQHEQLGIWCIDTHRDGLLLRLLPLHEPPPSAHQDSCRLLTAVTKKCHVHVETVLLLLQPAQSRAAGQRHPASSPNSTYQQQSFAAAWNVTESRSSPSLNSSV